MKNANVSYSQAVRRLRKAHDSVREAIGEDLEPHLRRLLKKKAVECPSRD